VNECKPLVEEQTIHLPATEDHLKVAFWCNRESAEVHKSPQGMSGLAHCYRAGVGVMKDPAQAAAWYQKAADSGEAAAKSDLAGLLLQGEASAGVERDTARAMDLFRQAAGQGRSLVHFSAQRKHILCHVGCMISSKSIRQGDKGRCDQSGLG